MIKGKSRLFSVFLQRNNHLVQFIHEDRPHRSGRTPHIFSSDGGRHRPRIPTDVQEVWRQYGVHRICIGRCPDTFRQQNRAETEYQ